MRRRGTRGGNDPGIFSFCLSLFHSLLSWQQAMMAEAAEERDDVAVVAAVVAGHGAGWLVPPLFSRRTGLDSLTPCMHDL